MTPYVSVLVGLVLLVLGAEGLVRGAGSLARRAGLSPLVIGLTVVAFGTSAPEIAVSVGAAYTGAPGLAVANVVGSNIFNILAILGISALLCPLVVERRLVRFDVPLMIGVTLAGWALLAGGTLARWEAGLLFAACVGFTVIQVRAGRRAARAEPERDAVGSPADGVVLSKPAGLGWSLVLLVVGLVVMVIGSRLLVSGASAVASALGVSDVIIGLTVVAAGTSLPELATSVVAAARGQRDIAVGNVVGSCVFNVLGILGITGLVAPQSLPVAGSILVFDLPVMIAATVACLPIVFTGHRIGRLEGGLFLAGYLAYTARLVLDASGHDAEETFTAVMLWIAGPIALVGVLFSVVRALRAGGTPADGERRPG